jgi:hypothetical protein
MVQQPGVVDDIYVTSHIREEITSHYPFLDKDWHTLFKPGYVAIKNSKEEVIEEMLNPRDSFAGYRNSVDTSSAGVLCRICNVDVL